MRSQTAVSFGDLPNFGSEREDDCVPPFSSATKAESISVFTMLVSPHDFGESSEPTSESSGTSPEIGTGDSVGIGCYGRWSESGRAGGIHSLHLRQPYLLS